MGIFSTIANIVSTDASGRTTTAEAISVPIKKERFERVFVHESDSDQVKIKKLVDHIGELNNKLSRLQQNLEDVTKLFRGCPTIGANYITAVSFVSGTNKVIQHKLGKAPMGYRIVNATVANPNYFRVANADANTDSLYITITPGSTFTADVEVY